MTGQLAPHPQDNLEKAAFVKLYLVSQGRLPLMSLTDLLTAAVQHPEKETLAWMILQSLYQARIINHANTGEHRHLCLLELSSILGLLSFSTGLASPKMNSVLDG